MLQARTHRKIYLVLLTLLGGCMVCSYWAANLMWVLLVANWLLEGRWEEKWRMAKESRLLQAVVGLWLLYALSFLWGLHMAEWLSGMQTVLPLLAVPAVLLTTRPPTGQARRTILWLYTGTVAVVAAIGVVRLLTLDGISYREAVPFISHIRFALHCCLALVICLTEAGRGRWRWGAWLLASGLLAFVLVIRSYTAVGVLASMSLVLALRSANRRRWTALWAALALAGVATVALETRNYYRLVPLATEPLQDHTANGRPYSHRQDGLVENGNYVHNYVCREEMQAEWTRRGGQPLDEPTASGYPLEASLIRYLNALGLTKDSLGVATLTETQMNEVERGVANPVYEHGWPVKRMVYVMLFEYENYRHYNAVAGFTVLQRLELWRAAWRVFLQHPWVGTGLGGLKKALEAELGAMESPLQGRGMYPHNQYLTWLCMFGIVGMVLIVVLFMRTLRGIGRQSAVVVAWMVAMAVSCLTENTLGTLAGILLFGWFMAFRR